MSTASSGGSNAQPASEPVMSPEDQAFLAKYGRLPPTKQILSSRLKNGDRKYFDSGDYALSKVGKSAEVGSAHPSPERIPHSFPPGMLKRASLDKGAPGQSGTITGNSSSNNSNTPGNNGGIVVGGTIRSHAPSDLSHDVQSASDE